MANWEDLDNRPNRQELIDQAVARAAAAAQDTLRRPTEAELDELFAELDKRFTP